MAQQGREWPIENGRAWSEAIGAVRAGLRVGGEAVAEKPGRARCQAVHRASATAPSLRCSRSSIARVTGTQRLTADVCAQHARMAADRPRLVREWVMGRTEPDDDTTAGAGDAPAPWRPFSRPADVVVTTTAEPASLSVIRAAVSGALAQFGWSPELRPGVLLAVGEAATNAVEHGSSPGAQVCVALHAGAGRIQVSVTDAGRMGSVVPLVIPEPPPASELRGRGLMLMRTLSQVLTIQSDGEGTVVTMEFTLRAAADAAQRPPGG